MSNLKISTAFLRVLTDSQCSARARLHALHNCNPSRKCLSDLLADRRIRGALRQQLTERYAEAILKTQLLGKRSGRPKNLHVDRHASRSKDAETVN